MCHDCLTRWHPCETLCGLHFRKRQLPLLVEELPSLSRVRLGSCESDGPRNTKRGSCSTARGKNETPFGGSDAAGGRGEPGRRRSAANLHRKKLGEGGAGKGSESHAPTRQTGRTPRGIPSSSSASARRHRHQHPTPSEHPLPPLYVCPSLPLPHASNIPQHHDDQQNPSTKDLFSSCFHGRPRDTHRHIGESKERCHARG